MIYVPLQIYHYQPSVTVASHQPDIIQLPENIGSFLCNIDELVAREYLQTLGIWLNNESTRAINTALVAQLSGKSDHWILYLMNPGCAFSYRIFKLSGGVRVSFTFAVIKDCCLNNHITIFRFPKVTNATTYVGT